MPLVIAFDWVASAIMTHAQRVSDFVNARVCIDLGPRSHSLLQDEAGFIEAVTEVFSKRIEIGNTTGAGSRIGSRNTKQNSHTPLRIPTAVVD